MIGKITPGRARTEGVSKVGDETGNEIGYFISREGIVVGLETPDRAHE